MTTTLMDRVNEVYASAEKNRLELRKVKKSIFISQISEKIMDAAKAGDEIVTIPYPPNTPLDIMREVLCEEGFKHFEVSDQHIRIQLKVKKPTLQQETDEFIKLFKALDFYLK